MPGGNAETSTRENRRRKALFSRFLLRDMYNSMKSMFWPQKFYSKFAGWARRGKLSISQICKRIIIDHNLLEFRLSEMSNFLSKSDYPTELLNSVRNDVICKTRDLSYRNFSQNQKGFGCIDAAVLLIFSSKDLI